MGRGNVRGLRSRAVRRAIEDALTSVNAEFTPMDGHEVVAWQKAWREVYARGVKSAIGKWVDGKYSGNHVYRRRSWSTMLCA